MKKAFTLVELLVVIGIIGVLASATFIATSGVSDRAKSVKCEANLKSIATSINASLMGGSYPFAQSAPYLGTDPNGDGVAVVYNVNKGWVSWLDQGATYPSVSEPSYSQPSYAGSHEDVNYALTNGTLWASVGGRHDCYLCPAHVAACQKSGVQTPGWSYQLNAFFGYNASAGSTSGIKAGSLGRAENRLLFAEIPALTLTSKIKAKTRISKLPNVNLTGANGDEAMDGCLRYKSSGRSESIGFNHVQGKEILGHVVFADGHIESFAAPKEGNYEELTDWLCLGQDVVYYNGKYDKVDTTASE